MIFPVRGGRPGVFLPGNHRLGTAKSYHDLCSAVKARHHGQRKRVTTNHTNNTNKDEKEKASKARKKTGRTDRPSCFSFLFFIRVIRVIRGDSSSGGLMAVSDLVLALTGASGAPYGVRLLEVLLR